MHFSVEIIQFGNTSVVNSNRKWKWPFIDILFFEDNATSLYDVTSEKHRHLYPRSDILPLKNGVFENMIMPVPHDIEAYLNRKFNMNEPCKKWWSHKRETGSVMKPSNNNNLCHMTLGL